MCIICVDVTRKMAAAADSLTDQRPLACRHNVTVASAVGDLVRPASSFCLLGSVSSAVRVAFLASNRSTPRSRMRLCPALSAEHAERARPTLSLNAVVAHHQKAASRGPCRRSFVARLWQPTVSRRHHLLPRAVGADGRCALYARHRANPCRWALPLSCLPRWLRPKPPWSIQGARNLRVWSITDWRWWAIEAAFDGVRGAPAGSLAMAAGAGADGAAAASWLQRLELHDWLRCAGRAPVSVAELWVAERSERRLNIS